MPRDTKEDRKAKIERKLRDKNQSRDHDQPRVKAKDHSRQVAKQALRVFVG